MCYSVILPLVRFEVSCICELRPLTQSIYCGKSTINRLSQASKDNKSNNFLPHPVYLYHWHSCSTSSSRNLIHYFSLPLRICYPTRTLTVLEWTCLVLESLLYWNEHVMYWNVKSYWNTHASNWNGNLTGTLMNLTGTLIALECICILLEHLLYWNEPVLYWNHYCWNECMYWNVKSYWNTHASYWNGNLLEHSWILLEQHWGEIRNNK
jgi:hypothetical protein